MSVTGVGFSARFVPQINSASGEEFQDLRKVRKNSCPMVTEKKKKQSQGGR
jgi:hypothetical protein